jgi:hypothetical protein
MAIHGSHDRKTPLSIELRLLILQYLVEAKEVPLVGNWITEKELKNGEMFYRWVHFLKMFKNHLRKDLASAPMISWKPGYPQVGSKSLTVIEA